ncbi:hypothetical protein D3C71_2142080 [compost metagenome]
MQFLVTRFHRHHSSTGVSRNVDLWDHVDLTRLCVLQDINVIVTREEARTIVVAVWA